MTPATLEYMVCMFWRWAALVGEDWSILPTEGEGELSECGVGCEVLYGLYAEPPEIEKRISFGSFSKLKEKYS